MRAFLIGIFLVLGAAPTWAGEAPIMVGDPDGCRVTVDYEAREQMLHFRPIMPAGKGCEVTPLMVQSALYMALDRQRANSKLALIFLGRLENYPWLSRKLTGHAMNNSGRLGFWDPVKGHASDGNDNQYVVDALSAMFKEDLVGHPYLPPFADVLAEYGYRIDGASAEKVLTKAAQPGLSERFPYDALLHLRITKIGP